jgi:hypothetical protein
MTRICQLARTASRSHHRDPVTSGYERWMESRQLDWRCMWMQITSFFHMCLDALLKSFQTLSTFAFRNVRANRNALPSPLFLLCGRTACTDFTTCLRLETCTAGILQGTFQTKAFLQLILALGHAAMATPRKLPSTAAHHHARTHHARITSNKKSMVQLVILYITARTIWWIPVLMYICFSPRRTW